MTFNRLNPLTGEVASSAAAMKASDIPAITAKAVAAFPVWAAQGPNARRAVLMRAADALEARKDAFVAAMMGETGSTAAWAVFNLGLAAGKGLNLAASDVHYAAASLTGWFKRADNDGVAGYAGKALARVWKSERFSWSLTKLMHRFPDDGPFERAMQVAELDYIATSTAAQTSIAENYVGLPT